MESAKSREKLKANVNARQPTALVAGGAGFIGSHLCEALITQGFNVIAIDNLSVLGPKKNIEKLRSSPNFSLWEADINKADFKLSPTISLTHIFHLASIEEHLASEKLSLQTLLVNSLGTKNLLDLALQRKTKFILVSSTEIFHGAFSQGSLNNYFGKPEDPGQISFSEAKRFAETLVAEYFRNYSCKATIIRIKDPYGPRMSLDVASPISQTIGAALNKNSVVLAGDGLETFNPTFISDIIFGIIKASLGEYEGKIFNVINPGKYTQRSIAENLQKLINGLQISFKKNEDAPLPSYPLIINPTEEQLGWEPKVDLSQGLRETVDFFKGNESSRVPETVSNQLKGADSAQEKLDKKPTLIRNIIITAIGALFFWVTMLPSLMLMANIYLGNKSIDKAQASLSADRPGKAVQEAERAKNSFKAGQSASKKIFWTLIAPQLSSSLDQAKNYLFYGENIAEATRFAALGLQIIKETEAAKLSSEEIADKLELAKSSVEQAENKLEIASSIEFEENALLLPTKSALYSLSKDKAELTNLIDTLQQSLR